VQKISPAEFFIFYRKKELKSLYFSIFKFGRKKYFSFSSIEGARASGVMQIYQFAPAAA
jgi:hypothetical protein